MQGDFTSATFSDSMAFSFEVDDGPLDTPTVLGELVAAEGVLNTPLNRDAKAFNFIKPDSDVNNIQQTKAALCGEYRVLTLAYGQCSDYTHVSLLNHY